MSADPEGHTYFQSASQSKYMYNKLLYTWLHILSSREYMICHVKATNGFLTKTLTMSVEQKTISRVWLSRWHNGAELLIFCRTSVLCSSASADTYDSWTMGFKSSLFLHYRNKKETQTPKSPWAFCRTCECKNKQLPFTMLGWQKCLWFAENLAAEMHSNHSCTEGTLRY